MPGQSVCARGLHYCHPPVCGPGKQLVSGRAVPWGQRQQRSGCHTGCLQLRHQRSDKRHLACTQVVVENGNRCVCNWLHLFHTNISSGEWEVHTRLLKKWFQLLSDLIWCPMALYNYLWTVLIWIMFNIHRSETAGGYLLQQQAVSVHIHLHWAASHSAPLGQAEQCGEETHGTKHIGSLTQLYK